jgi:hypothetical protein
VLRTRQPAVAHVAVSGLSRHYPLYWETCSNAGILGAHVFLEPGFSKSGGACVAWFLRFSAGALPPLRPAVLTFVGKITLQPRFLDHLHPAETLV